MNKDGQEYLKQLEKVLMFFFFFFKLSGEISLENERANILFSFSVVSGKKICSILFVWCIHFQLSLDIVHYDEIFTKGINQETIWLGVPENCSVEWK